MKFYLAPLEGITGYVYRNAFNKYFGDVDKYFTPFITPNQNAYLNRKEKKDVLREVNRDLFVIPQIMTNNAGYFTGLQKELMEMGYEEVNLNLGCPAATVVTKKKGAGLLNYPEELDDFLYQIFEKNIGKISVKTRIGMYEPEEFEHLLEIYNEYPLEELIIHPRVREDYYKGSIKYKEFEKALMSSKNPVVYNGDIHSLEDYKMLIEKYDGLDTVMLGRGVLKDPSLIKKCLGDDGDYSETIHSFMDEILNGYYECMKSERNVLFRMKELWLYLKEYYDEGEKYWKKINKSKSFKEYNDIYDEIRSILEVGSEQ